MSSSMWCWCLAIDHNRKPLANLLKVKREGNVGTLREAVKQNKPNDLARVDSPQLVVLRRTHPAISLDEGKGEEFEKQVEKWLSVAGAEMVELETSDTIVDLNLGEREVLLVQLPGALLTASKEDLYH